MAEELAQEALLRACERWDEVRTMRNPSGWVYRTALNLSASSYRRRAAEKRALQRSAPSRDVHIDADAADRLAVRAAVLGLPGPQRTVLALRHYLRLTVAEAAEVMGISEAAVKSHATRAVAALRRAILEPERARSSTDG